MAYVCNPSSWKAEAEGPEVQSHLWGHSEYKASLSYMRTYINNIKNFYNKTSHKVIGIPFRIQGDLLILQANH